MESFEADKFWEDRLKSKNNLEGVGFEKLGRPFNIWVYRLRRVAFLSMLKRNGLNPRKKKVIDIGSGTGFYIDIWKDLSSLELMGIDISPTAIERLKGKFPEVDFQVCDIGDVLDEKFNNRFDYVSCMDVLFHIVDDTRFKQAFNNIAKMIKPGGYFLYSDNFLKRDTIRGRHQVSHSEKDLLKLIEQNGFEIIERRPFMFLTNAPIDTNNIFMKLYWYVLENTLYVFKSLGYLLGPLLYFIDKRIINIIKSSPTTEIVLLRKKEINF